MQNIFQRCKHFFCATALGFAALATAQPSGVAPEQWSEQERQFVQRARSLYQQQGLTYTDEQAAQAVRQMRDKPQAVSAPQGVPESEWTAQEREFVKLAREQYAAQGMPMTQEQAQTVVQSMRTRLAQMTGSMGALQAMAQMRPPAAAPRTAPAPTAGAATSEEAIAQTIASWPPKPERWVLTERKDGFDINGVTVLDPEGRISSYAADPIGGSITYVLQGSQGVRIKSLGAGDPSRSLLLATGRQTSAGWELVTASGLQLSGQTLSVTSDGFMVGRESALFRYKAGQGVTSVPIPAGYFLAPLQRGNVGATGVVLLEKEGATGTNSATSLLANLQTIGAILGANRKEDFALLDLNTRKLHPLNISANGKTVNVHSQCRKKNWAVNECAQMQSFEALYDRYGLKNGTHYYWLAHWINTAAGPMAFTLEDGAANLYVTDLNTGRRVVALNRSLGIADWEVMQGADGSVGVKGKLAFTWHEVADVVSLLQGQAKAEGSPAADAKPAQ